MTLRRTGAADAVTDAAAASGADQLAQVPTSGRGLGRPLTEKVLSRLPGPRRLWIVVWALVPWLNLAVVALPNGFGQGRLMNPLAEILNRAAVSVAILLSLWGTARIFERLRRLPPVLSAVIEQDERDVAALFRGMDSKAVPLVLTAASVLILPIDEALTGDIRAALIQALTWMIIGIPLWTAIWTYLSVQLGLRSLGRGHLTLQTYQGDRSLGLRPVGQLAFTGFWLLLGVVAPLVVTNASDIPGAAVGILVLLAGLALFFLSLRGVHRQMVIIKHRELDIARALYMQAYQQVRDQPTLKVLEQQAGLLTAAEALEKRAERIQAWPFDETTFAQVLTIASSATAGILARLIADPIL
jgi:hypothetical protein